MLKINLLPKNLYEARKKKLVIAVFVLLAVFVGGGMMAWKMQIDKAADEMAAEAASLQAMSQEADNWANQAKAQLASIPDLQTKTQFFDDVDAYNKVYPDLYTKLAQFTYARVMYTSITPANGSTLTIEAHAKSIMDIGVYLLNMYKATHLFSSVTISAVPGYGQGSNTGGTPQATSTGGYSGPAEGGTGVVTTNYGGLGAIATGVVRSGGVTPGIDFTVTCTLRTPLVPPKAPGNAPAAGGLNGTPGAATPPQPAATPAPSTSGGGASEDGGGMGARGGGNI